MIQLPPDAPGSAACGYSGRPLLAVCPGGHRRTVPFRRLATHFDDSTPLHDRPFRCPTCGSTTATLFVFDQVQEFERVRNEMRPPEEPMPMQSPARGNKPPPPTMF